MPAHSTVSVTASTIAMPRTHAATGAGAIRPCRHRSRRSRREPCGERRTDREERRPGSVTGRRSSPRSSTGISVNAGSTRDDTFGAAEELARAYPRVCPGCAPSREQGLRRRAADRHPGRARHRARTDRIPRRPLPPAPDVPKGKAPWHSTLCSGSSYKLSGATILHATTRRSGTTQLNRLHGHTGQRLHDLRSHGTGRARRRHAPRTRSCRHSAPPGPSPAPALPTPSASGRRTPHPPRRTGSRSS
jgi:hypothetical protein